MNLLQNSSSTSILPLTEARKIYEMALLEKETISEEEFDSFFENR